MKILKYLVFGLFLILPLSQARAQDLSASEQEIINRLETNCYNPAKTNFEQTRGKILSTAVGRIDFSQIAGIPPEFRAAIQELEEEASSWQPSTEEVKDNFRKLAQINLDLAACYQKELASDPQLLAKAQELSQKASAQKEAVENFDFNQIFDQNQPLTVQPVVQVRPQEAKIFRLLTFCLDKDRKLPFGQEYYLAGSADKVQNNLCQILKGVQSDQDISSTQNQIWQGKTEETETKTPANKLPLIMTLAGSLLFLVTLTGGLLKFSTLVLRSLLLVSWLAGLVIFLGAAGLGVWQLKKTSVATLAKTTLENSFQKGEVSLKVYSTGTITFLDVKITNNSNQNLEFDTGCLFFVPALAESPLSISLKTGQTEGEKEKPEITNIEDYPQRLGAAGATGNGPPYVDEPSIPWKVLEEWKKLAADQLKESTEELKKDPNDENLKDLYDKTNNCQQLGCGQDQASLAEAAATLQKEAERQKEAYEQNQSEENLSNYLRAVERSQALGGSSISGIF